MNAVALLIVCTVVVSQEVVQGQSQEHRLRADLYAGYDDIRREVVPKQDEALTVKLGMSVNSILDFDETKSTISVYGWQTIAWTDINLQWNPEDYDGISDLRLPSKRIWRPDLQLYNSLTLGSGQDTSVLAVVNSDGDVFFIPPTISQVKCERVPKDDDNNNNDDDNDDDDDDDDKRKRDEDDGHPEWVCKFKIGSWTYDGFTINLALYSEGGIDLSNYISDDNYDIISTSSERNFLHYACCPEPYVDVTFELRIRRK